MRPEDHIQSTLKAHRVLWATTLAFVQPKGDKDADNFPFIQNWLSLIVQALFCLLLKKWVSSARP